MMTFQQLYTKIAIEKFYLRPNYPRMDNWAVDLYETPSGFIAGMSDGGYCRWVGFKHGDKIKWKVSDNYPNPLEFVGITEEEFQNLPFPGN
jgi:hypothetical protein